MSQSNKSFNHRPKKVPSSRLARLTTFGSLAAKVAGNVVLSGAKQLASGESPSLKRSILQPKNIEQLASKLSELRGAAMKLGQLLSMDAGDLLPSELSQLLATLRDNASAMPHKQLVAELKMAWGENWLDGFSHFELSPFASASIGQVHLAYLDSGEKVAVKVQYPGIAKAINSDVDNVALLLKMSGLLPEHIQIDQLLAEAKKQLLAEADYRLEASYIDLYRSQITRECFVIPEVYPNYSQGEILVMSYLDGVAIDTIVNQPQATKNQVIRQLTSLFFDELFRFRLMQTDPNFANYLYQEESERIVLLDFGATREVPEAVSTGYLKLITAGMKRDKTAMVEAAKAIGFFDDDISCDYLEQILDILILACQPLDVDGEYDFANSGLAQKIKDKGLAINREKHQWHTPPVDAIFIHRKIAGLYLLAAKLNAQVNVRQLFLPYAELGNDFDGSDAL